MVNPSLSNKRDANAKVIRDSICVAVPFSRLIYLGLNSVLNVNIVTAFNQEKVLVGVFSVIVQTSRTFVSSSTRQTRHYSVERGAY